MERLVAEAADALADAPAEDVIKWATDTFGDRICITSSMTDAVIIHLAVAGAARHRRGLPRHRLPLRRDHRHQGRGIGGLPGQRDQRHALADGRGAGRRARGAAVRPQPGPVLLPAQGRAAGAGPGARTTRGSPGCARRRRAPAATPRVVEWDAAAADGQGQPDRRLDPGAGGQLHRRARRAGQPAGLRRLPVDRLLRPAPPGWSPARTRAAAAGRAPARPNAASTC